LALPKQSRLRSSRDFARVHRQGSRAGTAHLAMRALKSKGTSASTNNAGLKNPRERADEMSAALSSCFGISISRKVSKRAVVRNRIKRQLQAIIRRYLPDILPGWQVVIVVRASAVECEFDDFLRELEYLLKKLSVLA
jgi:ribonuclease P protein component